MNAKSKLLLYLFPLLAVACICHAEETAPFVSPKPKILVLHSYHHGFTWSDNVSSGIREGFKAYRDLIELRFEFMDTRRYSSPDYLQKFHELLYAKYKDGKPDLIIASDDNALAYLLDRGKGFFREIPAVFCSVSGYEPRMRGERPITGVQEAIDIKSTLDVALDLHPGTDSVAVITDNTRTGRALKTKAVEVFKNYEERLRFTYLVDFTVDELTRKVASLEPGTIIFLFIFTKDSNGRVLSHEQNLRLLSKFSKVPIYSVWCFYLGHGIVGGKLTSGEAEGRLAAEMALRILHGENAGEIPLETSPIQYMFDARQLERFGVDTNKLPPGSLLVNQTFSFYQQYKWMIWAVVGVFILLFAVMAILAGNIALRQKAQNALKESEEKFSKAFMVGPDVLLITRFSDGAVIDANDQFFETTGYGRDEVIGKSAAEIQNWADPQERERFVRQIEQNGKVDNMEVYFRMKDGRTGPFLISARPIELNGVKCIISNTRDISDRKAAENALRQSEERFRDLAENIKEVFWLFDWRTQKVIYVSPAYETVWGRSVDELYARYDEWAESIHPDDLAYAQESFKEILATGGGEPRQYRIVRPDGAVRWISDRGFAVRDNTGNIRRIAGIAEDVTEQKSAAEEKKRLEAQLIQAQKMEAIGTLAGGIAHDFNNLLMGIQGRTSLMKADMDASHPHFEHAGGIESYVKDAVDLTRQLLGFARGGKYEVVPTNLNDLVKGQNRMFGRTTKEVSIHGKYNKSLWPAEVDQGQIKQVLLNLYVNAWQAMPTGGDIYVQTDNIELDENHTQPFAVTPGRYIKITVTDTGTGMGEQIKQRIFEPFFTTKEMGRGTGLGLASVYGIIKNHGGFITVYSEVGEGSTFNIYLPASTREADVDVQTAKGWEKGQGTILLVDDEKMILEVGSQMLKRLGYNVMVAHGGSEAVATYRANQAKIDLIILDMVMPRLSGGETFDQLRNIDAGVRVILSSGYSINGKATDILNRGCDGFIQKPFNLGELSEKISQVLAK